MSKGRITGFPEDLTWRIRVAASLVGMTPSKYVRIHMERITSELADANPLVAAVYDVKP